MRIQGIFFDLGWTLETPLTGDWMLTKKFREYISEEIQNSVDPVIWRNAMRSASLPLIRNHVMETEAEEEEAFTGWYYDLLADAGLPVTLDIAREMARDRTYNLSNCILMEDTAETLLKLKRDGYRLGIISDTWPSVITRLKSYGLYDLFDCMTFSYERGIFKPDIRIYEDALKKMGLPAENTVFVDDLVKNLDGAAAAGMPGILSLARGNTAPDPRYPSIKSPSGLSELSMFSKEDQ